MTVLRKLGVLLSLTSTVFAGTVAANAGASSTPYSSYTILPDKAHKHDIVAFGLNTTGQIVGNYMDDNFLEHGFLRPGNGNYNKLDVPTGVPGSTAPTGINDLGVVVGSYADNTSYGERGFVYNHGTFTTFAVNLANAVPDSTYAFGINDWGQVVGNYLGTDGVTHGFVLCNGVYTSFDIKSPAPGVNVNSTQPSGINDLGQIVGLYTTDVNGDPTTAATHGFILSGGKTTTLDVPGALNGTFGAGTQATGINLLGQVSGNFVDAAGTTHGFVYSCGAYKILDAPGAVNTYADGINNLGQIIGYFDDGTVDAYGEVFYSFILNP